MIPIGRGHFQSQLYDIHEAERSGKDLCRFMQLPRRILGHSTAKFFAAADG